MNEYRASITRFFHWSSAVIILALLITGFYMTYNEYFSTLYYQHKSFGVIVAALILVRLIWRFKFPWQSSAIGTPNEKLVSGVHKVIVLMMVVMPISGLMLSGFGGYSLHLFDWVIVPKNFNEAGDIVAYNSVFYEIGTMLHEIVGYTLSFFILLHTLASFKHHFVEKDNTLKRMLGRA